MTDTAKQDITSVGDIAKLVDAFYVYVRKDPVIGPIFIGAIREKWPEHLEKMVRFWQTVIFGVPVYTGSPFPLHARMPLQQKHFDTWLALWTATVDRLFAGKNADDAKLKARNMTIMFVSKLDNPFYKASGRQ
ncbi:MAG TPA: group III truncated hemoglobin [Puia sp.]|nr:group III truncated hemoglobin [Puia sp.]